jgi:hypothetical protein
MITERSKLDNICSREPSFYWITQDYFTNEAPRHFASEAVLFSMIVMAVILPLLNGANAVLGLIR